jgi:hypothetical protein
MCQPAGRSADANGNRGGGQVSFHIHGPAQTVQISYDLGLK